MRPAFLVLASAALASITFAMLQAVAFMVLLALPVHSANAADAPLSGTLYRWKEDDGSLTFSPDAPTDGTPYETIHPMSPPPSAAGRADIGTARLIDGTSSASDVTASASASASATDRIAPPVSAPTSGQPTGISRGALPQIGAASASGDTRSTAGSVSPSPAVVAASEKNQRCGELAKRVVSLERRLSTPLTAEAMDTTVLQMARYQQSVDRHCR